MWVTSKLERERESERERERDRERVCVCDGVNERIDMGAVSFLLFFKKGGRNEVMKRAYVKQNTKKR